MSRSAMAAPSCAAFWDDSITERRSNGCAQASPPVQLPDSGGNPLLDENGQLLALLTRNVDCAGKALALKMSHIISLAAQLKRDQQLMPDSDYCAACGGRARSQLYGGEHCEILWGGPGRRRRPNQR